MSEILGKVVVITGGARGIGRQMAVKVARLGGRVVVYDVAAEALKAAVDEITAAGGEAHGYVCDVSDRREVYHAAGEVKTRVGPVDIVINSAGIISGRRLLEIPDERIEAVFGVNVDGPMRTSRAFLRSVAEHPDRERPADIVNVVSISALTTGAGAAAYNSSKAALLKLTEVLQTEVRERSWPVRVCALSPSAMNTPMMDQWNLPEEKMMDPAVVAGLIHTAVTLPPQVLLQSLVVTGPTEYYPR